MIERRAVLQWAALGAATLALPESLAGCAGGADGATSSPLAASALGSAASLPRTFGAANGYRFDVFTSRNRVDFYDPSGALVGRADRRLNGPVSVAVDANEHALVVDMGNSKVHAFDLAARPLGSFGSASFETPLDVAVERRTGTVAVADSLNHRVALLDPRGHLTASLGKLGRSFGELNGPASVAYSPDGSTLYVADAGNARVHVFSAGGRALDVFGGRGEREGRFLSPRCVRIDPAGYVFVADRVGGFVSVFDGGHRFVQRFRPALASGAAGSPRWISSRPDGSLTFGAAAGLPS